MSKTIPAGYQIHITSWENDADYYNTKVISGLTKDTAKFYVEFAGFFNSCHDHHKPAGYGNAYDSDEVNWDDLTVRFEQLVRKYPDALTEIGWDQTELDFADSDSMRDSIGELAYEIMGASETYVFRVFESYEAYYYPEAVKGVKL